MTSKPSLRDRKLAFRAVTAYFVPVQISSVLGIAEWRSGNGIGRINDVILYVGPGWYWDGWPSSDVQRCNQPPWLTQPPTLRWTRNEQLGQSELMFCGRGWDVKAGMSHSTWW